MKKALERIINYVIELARPDKIILFGSLIDGTDNIYSDVDLVVVIESNYRSKELELRISSFAKELAVQADILVRTPEEIAEAALKPLSFLASVISHGQTVYERVDQVSLSTKRSWFLKGKC